MLTPYSRNVFYTGASENDLKVQPSGISLVQGPMVSSPLSTTTDRPASQETLTSIVNLQPGLKNAHSRNGRQASMYPASLIRSSPYFLKAPALARHPITLHARARASVSSRDLDPFSIQAKVFPACRVNISTALCDITLLTILQAFYNTTTIEYG